MMKNQLIVGVMGGGIADRENAEVAYRLGNLIAAQGQQPSPPGFLPD